MIPDEETAGAAPPTFPYVRLAVGVLVFHTILAVTYPLSPLRSAVAIVSFFAMGYCALALIAGGRIRMSSAEILAFTVGLTILITSLSALAVSIAGIPITEFAVVVVGLPIGFLALILRRPAEGPWRTFADFIRTWLDFSDYSPTEKRVAAVLLLAIVGALVVFISLAGVQYPDRSSMGIAITGADGSAESIPGSFVLGQPQTIEVHVLSNSTPGWPSDGPGSFVVRIRLAPQNATGTEPFHPVSATSPLRLDAFGQYDESITVASQASWTKSFSIIIDTAGRLVLRFELVRADDTVVVGSHVPVIVT